MRDKADLALEDEEDHLMQTITKLHIQMAVQWWARQASGVCMLLEMGSGRRDCRIANLVGSARERKQLLNTTEQLHRLRSKAGRIRSIFPV